MSGSEEYSDKVLEEYHSPYGMETLFDPDGHAVVEGVCGDTIEMFLRLDEEKLLHMSYRTDGCIATVACCSMLSKIILGRAPKEAESIREEDLVEALGGLPSDHLHCATLAVDTFFKALLELQPDPRG
ncbi:MAG: iron-sulfur cluster assembly scaffold protein [Candidatus Thermoplasmatota archaeon]|nr:iron-sulfur cluster assembly scaffold protein [Candidatus Thermoplasmatota archaeon]